MTPVPAIVDDIDLLGDHRIRAMPDGPRWSCYASSRLQRLDHSATITIAREVLMLNNLADQCEKVAAPDREIDIAIFLALGGVLTKDRRTGLDRDTNRYTGRKVGLYTASIDAAATLAPDGWTWTLYSDASCEIGREPASGCIMTPTFITTGSSPALALTAACLRARDGSP